MRRLGLAIVVHALVCAPGPARAGERPFLVDRTARAHYELAGKAAGRGDYRTAAAELDAAYAVEPHPELLFVRAEVRRRLGECKTALILYREFIASAPSEAATRQADEGASICEQSIAAAEPRPAPVVPAPASPPRPVDPPPPPPAREVAWQRDPVGGVLLGLGVVALAASAGLGGGAAVPAREVRVTDRHSEQVAALRTVNVLLASSGAAAAVGVGLVVGAALRYRAVERRARLGAWFDGRGGGLALTGRF